VRAIPFTVLLAVASFTSEYSAVAGISGSLSSVCVPPDSTPPDSRDYVRVPGTTVNGSDTSRSTGSSAQGFRMAKSPWRAVGLSAVLPGAGQIYTENYWKVPVIVGLGSYWVYEWVKLNNKFHDFSDLYSASIVASPPDGNSRLKGNRDFYHDERDKFAWFLAGLYLANLVDAYVGAHLYDFDVSPELTYDGRLVPRVTATVRLVF